MFTCYHMFSHVITCYDMFHVQDTRNPVAGGVVAVKDPNDQDILVAKLRIKLRLRYSIEELAEDYITRARVRQQDRGGKRCALRCSWGHALWFLLFRTCPQCSFPWNNDNFRIGSHMDAYGSVM